MERSQRSMWRTSTIISPLSQAAVRAWSPAPLPWLRSGTEAGRSRNSPRGITRQAPSSSASRFL
ncbi:hypothetical protein BME99_04200 [Pseudomonas protegens]|nr:hypothetical protein BME99_04200 [Pseudomonas protegens]